jgi:hypothetical protein
LGVIMMDSNYLDVIRFIAQRLEGTAINWAITGSCSLALQGVAVVVHDIDLRTDTDGAYAIEQLFSAYSRRKVVYAVSQTIRSHFGALAINDIHVEIIGDPQMRRADTTWSESGNIGRYKRWVTLGELRVPVLSLEFLRDSYRELGRTDKLALVETWLQRA